MQELFQGILPEVRLVDQSMKDNPEEKTEVEKFLMDHKSEMPYLYSTYDYEGDFYDEGFPNLFDLELKIIGAAKQNSFDQELLMKLAIWGKLRNKKTIEGITHPIKITLYPKGEPANWLSTEPANVIDDVERRIPGFGATFSSKLLHFAAPQVFGILDTWLVRTFGEGDPVHQRYKFLKLKVTNPKGGWRIPIPQPYWPEEYGRWIRILNYIAYRLNEEKILCPHPPNYIEAELRQDGIWLPADVETALFSFAYEGRGVKKKIPSTEENQHGSM